MNQNKLKMLFGVGSIVSAVVAIVLFLVALLAVRDQVFVRVMLFVVAFIAILLFLVSLDGFGMATFFMLWILGMGVIASIILHIVLLIFHFLQAVF